VTINDCQNAYMISIVASPAPLDKLVIPEDYDTVMSMTNLFTLDPNCMPPTVSGASQVTCGLFNHHTCISLVESSTEVSSVDVDIKGDVTIRFYECPPNVNFQLHCTDIYANPIDSNVVSVTIMDCTQIYSVTPK
jgi:hypothetical protein